MRKFPKLVQGANTRATGLTFGIWPIKVRIGQVANLEIGERTAELRQGQPEITAVQIAVLEGQAGDTPR